MPSIPSSGRFEFKTENGNENQPILEFVRY
jgi:hypothetical protein